MPWAIKWVAENQSTGRREYIMGRYGSCKESVPSFVNGYTKMVFSTRQAARDFITEHFGYIRSRPDLRKEPFGWKTPAPVRVTINVEEIKLQGTPRPL